MLACLRHVHIKMRVPVALATVFVISIVTDVYCRAVDRPRQFAGRGASGSSSDSSSSDETAMSMSDVDSRASSSDSRNFPGQDTSSESEDFPGEDTSSESEGCVTTRFCDPQSNALQAKWPAAFNLINTALHSVSISGLFVSTGTLLAQANSFSAGGVRNCLSAFDDASRNELRLKTPSGLGFEVILTSKDPHTHLSPSSAAVEFRNLKVQYIFRNLGTFGTLEIDFSVSPAGELVSGSEVFRFRTTQANDGLTTFDETSFDLVLNRLVSRSLIERFSES